MQNEQRRQYEKKAADYLKGVEEIYVFDIASGVYKPKSREAEEHTQQYQTRVTYESPIQVRTGRDFVSWVISALTLLVVAYYTFVTAGILQTSQVTAVGTMEAAWASRNSAEIMSETLKETQKSTKILNSQLIASQSANEQAQWAFEVQSRPRLGISIESTIVGGVPNNPRMANVTLQYKLPNEGQVEAIKIRPLFQYGSDFVDPSQDLKSSICTKAAGDTSHAISGSVFPKVRGDLYGYQIPGDRSNSAPFHIQGCIAYEMPRGHRTFFTHIDIRFNPPERPGTLFKAQDQSIVVDQQ